MKDIHEVLRQKQAKYAQLGKQIEMLQQAAEKLREVAPLLAENDEAKTTSCWRKSTTRSVRTSRWLRKPGLVLAVRHPRQRDRRLLVGRKRRALSARQNRFGAEGPSHLLTLEFAL